MFEFSRDIYSSRISQLLIKKNIKQIELALSIGVSNTLINDIIRKRRTGSLEVACLIAEHLECSIDYLVGLSDEP